MAQASAPDGASEISLALVHDLVHSLRTAGDRRAVQNPVAALQVHDDECEVGPASTILRDLVAEASLQRPVLVAIDDLQSADEDSLAVLSLATGRMPGTRSMVVAAARPAAAADPRLATWQRLDLGPLDERDAIILLRQSLGEPLEATQARALVRALGRCPLAIVECRRLLTPAQIAGTDPLPDPVPVGTRLQHAWARLAADLPERAQDALLVLSALDTSPRDLVAGALARAGCGESDLDQARAVGLVVKGRHGAPAIGNPLARAAVLGLHSPESVRATHQLVADLAVATGSPPAVVIGHLRRACSMGDEQCIAELETQAQRSQALGHAEVAARGWLVAAQLSPNQQDRVARGVQAARAWLMGTTSAEGGSEVLTILNEEPLSPPDTVWREWLRAEVLASHDLTRAAAAALVAARHADTMQPTLVPWLLWDAAATSWMAGDTELGLTAARRLERWTSHLVRPARGVPAGLGPGVLGAALLQAGITDEGVRHVRAAREAAPVPDRAAGHESSGLLNSVALDELLLDDTAAAEARVETLSARLGDERSSTTAAVGAIEAWRAWRRGSVAAARDLAREAALTAQAVRAAAAERRALSLLVELTSTTGSRDELEPLLERLRDLAGYVGDRQAMVSADRSEGLLALAEGRPRDAVASLERVASCPLRGRTTADAALAGRVDLVEAYVVTGDRAAASALAADLVPRLQTLSEIDPDAPALRSRVVGLVADAPADREQLADAVALHRRGSNRLEAERTRLMYADALAAAGHRAQARRELDAAESGLRRLGASPWLRSVARRREQSESPRRVDVFAALTPAERHVADVAATGASNHDVAEKLSLSPRTVEFHLGNIYRKLDLHSRGQLVRLAASVDSER